MLSASNNVLGREENFVFLKKSSLPSASSLVLGKAGEAAVFPRQTWQLCRAPRQEALGKGSLPSVALGKGGIQFFCFFAFYHYKHNKSYIYIT